MFASNIQVVTRTFFFLLAFSLLCWSCAQQGSPTGGPRDETPPRLIASEPTNYSTRFDADRIILTFDEFIVLENVNQELIVSPPLDEKPEVKLRKKSIVIQLDGPLKEETTYTLNFGSAIKDLHEGNPLTNFEYVFSTGEVLDSMAVRGIIRNAEDLTFSKDPVLIMLYRELADSVPLKEIPLYVGRSDDSGVFSVNNLRPDEYKVFALKDGNNNLMFDLPTEEIAFLDSSLTVNAGFARKLLEEAGMIDSLGNVPSLPELPADSLMPADSVTLEQDTLRPPGPDLNAIYVDLYLFTEETEIQYITDYTREDRRRIDLHFARPLTDSFRYRFITPGPDSRVERIDYLTSGRDSLVVWLTDSLEYKLDTLALEVKYIMKDSTNRDVLIADTLQFTYREQTQTRRRPGKEGVPVERLNLTTIRNNGSQELNQDLPVTLDLPLVQIRDSLIHLYRMVDTLEIPEPFEVTRDTASIYRAWLNVLWEPDASYRLQLLPGAFSSPYPVENDTVNLRFKVRDNEYYGQILLNLQDVKGQVLVQLISGEKVVRHVSVKRSGQLILPFLAPKEYRIKVIHDRNGNGKWDTGKYLEHLQPEAVEYMPGSLTVRSNWDHEVTLKLER